MTQISHVFNATFVLAKIFLIVFLSSTINKLIKKQCSETVAWPYDINVDCREFALVHYHAYTDVTKIDLHFKLSPGHLFLDKSPWACYSETIYAMQQNSDNKSIKSGLPKSHVLMCMCLVRLLSKTKPEPMMSLFSLVKINLWKARDICSNGC